MGRKPLTPEQKEQKRLALNARLREEYANNSDGVRDRKKKRYHDKIEHFRAYNVQRYHLRKKELEDLRQKVKELEAQIPQAQET
jgi:hypothetical protein